MASSDFQYERRLVAFIDILGWSAACEAPNKLSTVADIATNWRTLLIPYSKDFKDKLTTTPGATLSVDHQHTELTMTGWSFCTKTSERVYITAEGCEIEFGETRGL